MCQQIQIQNIGLQHVAEQLKTIVELFQDIIFFHVYKEKNQIVDKLSKDALALLQNHFVLSEFHDGQEVILQQDTISSFKNFYFGLE